MSCGRAKAFDRVAAICELPGLVLAPVIDRNVGQACLVLRKIDVQITADFFLLLFAILEFTSLGLGNWKRGVLICFSQNDLKIDHNSNTNSTPRRGGE